MWRFIGIFSLLACFLAGCATAPVTGRRQLLIIPSEQAAALGAQSYEELKASTPISAHPAYNRLVNKVGRDIARVADDPGFEWEFTVFDDDRPNAFALPGGKVGVFAGLFQVVENEDQLAAVLAHEVGHAVANHGSERLSRAATTNVALTVLGAATRNAPLVGTLTQAAKLGVELPFTRKQESEADEIGVIYMARAGYDPSQAINLWENFGEYGGERPPEFLSTHPAPETRIERIRALLPDACVIYQQISGRYCPDYDE